MRTRHGVGRARQAASERFDEGSTLVRRDAAAQAAQRTPVEDLEAAVGVLNKGGATLHPIAIVAVQHAVQLAQRRAVDVPADDAVEAALLRLAESRCSKLERLEISVEDEPLLLLAP